MMFNKIITKILDNYYAHKFADMLEYYLRTRNLDVNFKIHSDSIELYLKPKRHSTYTFCCSWRKRDALECMVADRKRFEKFIDRFIEDMNKQDKWR